MPANFRLILLISILFAETVCAALFSDAVRAIVVTCLVVFAIDVICFDLYAKTDSATIKSESLPIRILFVILMVIGTYGFLVALYRNNENYYVMADLYHWFVELLLLAALTFYITARVKNEEIVSAVSVGGVLQESLGWPFYYWETQGS